MANSLWLKKQFPTAANNTGDPNAYCFTVWIESAGKGSDGKPQVVVKGQATSSGNWDWWVTTGCPIRVYTKSPGGVEVLQATVSLANLNLPGWGTNGSIDSGIGTLCTLTGLTKDTQMRVTVDCSAAPSISSGGSSWTPGFWDSGLMAYWPGIEFTTPPVISGSLVNTTPYTNPVDGKKYTNISSSETSVGLEYTKSGGDDETHYRHWHTGQNEPSSWSSAPSNNRYTESGLSAGANYTCSCRIYNEAGSSGVATWKGRTRHKIPVVKLSHDHATQAGLEDLDITWQCDKNVACIYYRIKGETNWRIGAGQRSASSDIGITGVIHVFETEATVEGSKDLYPFTDYTIEVKVLSTVAYDSLESNVVSIDCKTDKRAELTASSDTNIIIGSSMHILKKNESGNNNDIRFQTRPYDASSIYADWCERNLEDNDETIVFTEREWDTVYRRFLNPASASKSQRDHDNIKLLSTLVTYGRVRVYTNTYEGLVTITGDMFTAHTNVNNTVKRAKVWCRPDGQIRRGITWITAQKGVWRRGI